MSLNGAEDARKPTQQERGENLSPAIWPLGEKSLLIPNLAVVLTAVVGAEDDSWAPARADANRTETALSSTLPASFVIV